MRRRIFISYKRKSEAAPGQDSEVMAHALRAQLALDYDVFMDAAITGNQLWQGEITTQLAGCDGAVALLSPAALESQWVRHELSVLTQRRFTASPPLCLLVAMVGDADVAALGRSPFQAMAIEQLQAYVPAKPGSAYANYYRDEAHLFELIAARLTQELPSSRLTPRQRLSQRAAELLGKFPNQLDELEQILKPKPGPNETAARLLRLAEAFLLAVEASRSKLNAVITRLEGKLPAGSTQRGDLQQLLDCAFPLWVSAAAAATLAHARAADTFPVLSAENPWTVEQYIRRAEEFPDGWTKVDILSKGSEAGVAEQVVEHICNKLLLSSERRKVKALSLQEKLKAISVDMLQSKVFFPLVTTEEDATSLLALDCRFVAPILHRAKQALATGVWIEPPLAAEDEADAANDYEELVTTITQQNSRTVGLI